MRGTRNNAYQANTGRVSPLRPASIIEVLSPREMVREFTKRGATDDFGIEGYNIPKGDSPKKKTLHGYINRHKGLGPIQSEMKFRKDYPGAASYDLPIE